MKVWSAIFNFFAVMLLGFLLIYFYQVDKINTKQFEEARLRTAVDYATEAAFRATISIDDLGMDYADMGSVKLNPSMALDTFDSIMALNYDMAITDDNNSMIENSIATAILFTSDGYYLLEEQKTSPDDYEKWWSPKKPYLYEDSGYKFALNIDNEKWVSVRNNAGTMQIQEGKTYNEAFTNLPGAPNISKAEAKRLWTNQITDEINYIIYERNLENSKREKMGMVYIPTTDTKKTINSIDRPTLMLFLQGVDYAGTNMLNATSVGGTRIDRQKKIVGFTESGRNYYAYESQLPDSVLPNAIEFFDTMSEAADNGYNPHFDYLRNEIESD